ncbi:MAG: hypothetical protein ACLP50_33985 [Solirubrobacteraceae bacterium]
MEAKETYSRDDLLTAWLEHERSRDSHADIADYYYRQAWALGGAFGGWGPGIRLSQCPREHAQLWTVFERSVKHYNGIYLPWGHFLAGGPNPERAEVQARHGPAIEQAADRLRGACRALLLDLIERIWGIGPAQTVSRDAVKENGFDPDTPAPDFDLYW